MEVVIHFATELIELFENYYSNKKFLKGHAQRQSTLITYWHKIQKLTTSLRQLLFGTTMI